MNVELCTAACAWEGRSMWGGDYQKWRSGRTRRWWWHTLAGEVMSGSRGSAEMPESIIWLTCGSGLTPDYCLSQSSCFFVRLLRGVHVECFCCVPCSFFNIVMFSSIFWKACFCFFLFRAISQLMTGSDFVKQLSGFLDSHCWSSFQDYLKINY